MCIRDSTSNQPATSKPRKLTWKEKTELDGMETAILDAEKDIARIENLFADPEFHSRYGTKARELNQEMESAKQKTAALYSRWEELETIKSASH